MSRVIRKKTAVLLVDKRAAIRQGLRALLKSVPNLEVVGEVGNGRSVLKSLKKTPPDVVVMDVSMPMPDGLAAIRQILQCAPRAKILVLTSYGDESYVDKLVEAGAAGFLIKQTAVNDLVQAIREVQRGNIFISPLIAQRLQQQREVLVNMSTTPPLQPEPQWFPREPLEILRNGLPEISPEAAVLCRG